MCRDAAGRERIERQRCLPGYGQRRDFDSGGAAAGERCPSAPTTGCARTCPCACLTVTASRSLLISAPPSRQYRGDLKLCRVRLQSPDQMPIFDVVTECIEIDVGGGEHDLGRSHQSLRVIDDTDLTKRSGMGLARAPHAESRQRRYGTDKERGRAMVVRIGEPTPFDASRGTISASKVLSGRRRRPGLHCQLGFQTRSRMTPTRLRNHLPLRVIYGRNFVLDRAIACVGRFPV